MSKREEMEIDFDNVEVEGIEVSGIKKGRKNIKNKIQFNMSLNAEQKETRQEYYKIRFPFLLVKLVLVKPYLQHKLLWKLFFIVKLTEL